MKLEPHIQPYFMGCKVNSWPREALPRLNGFLGCKVPIDLVKVSVKELISMGLLHNMQRIMYGLDFYHFIPGGAAE